MFNPGEFVTHINTEIHEDTSGITDPLMTEFPKKTEKDLMNHANLQYNERSMVIKGACLNYNILGICNEAN